MLNILSWLANIAHTLTVYFRIVDALTLHKSSILLTKTPFANQYKTIFTTLKLTKKLTQIFQDVILGMHTIAPKEIGKLKITFYMIANISSPTLNILLVG
jgi:hypothetical protein